MTIELLDLDDLPSNLQSQARTLVAVPNSSGPLRYKAALGAGGSSYTGTGPIVVNGNVISLGQSDATTGQLLGWNGTAWAPTSLSGSYTLLAATGSTLGGVKSGGDVTVGSDGTMTVNATSTHALSAGSGLASGDEIPVYSVGAGGDVKYTAAQVSAFVQAALAAAGITFAKRVSTTPIAIAYAATVNVDASLGNTFPVGVLTGACSVNAPTNLVNNQEITLIFQQDGTGGRVLTLNSIWVLRSGDTLPTAANAYFEVSGRYNSTLGKIHAGVASWAS